MQCLRCGDDATVFLNPSTMKPLKKGGYCKYCFESLQARSVRGPVRTGRGPRTAEQRQDMESMKGGFNGWYENALRSLEEG